MSEVVTHSSLTTHSAPFSLAGGIYQLAISGTIAHGNGLPELQQLVNGSFVSLNPPAKFQNGEAGACRNTKVLPASSFRWTVPGTMHNINTNVTKIG